MIPLEWRVWALDRKAEIERAAAPVLLSGTNMTCPCCGRSYRRFSHFGRPLRLSVLCPNCHSLERHRLVWLFVARETELGRRPMRILHVAPEPILRKLLRSVRNVCYVSVDLRATGVDVHMDVTRLALPDSAFDAVLCNHVLEHVPEDGAAMREIHRVLKPDGWAVLQVPMRKGLDRTLEDPAATAPEERRSLYGQEDHVRLYGADYGERLRAAGFDVRIRNSSSNLTAEELRRFGIDPDEDLYVCFKAPRA